MVGLSCCDNHPKMQRGLEYRVQAPIKTFRDGRQNPGRVGKTETGMFFFPMTTISNFKITSVKLMAHREDIIRGAKMMKRQWHDDLKRCENSKYLICNSSVPHRTNNSFIIYMQWENLNPQNKPALFWYQYLTPSSPSKSIIFTNTLANTGRFYPEKCTDFSINTFLSNDILYFTTLAADRGIFYTKERLANKKVSTIGVLSTL